MQIFESASQMHQWTQQKRGDGLSVGFVPTQGCLHQGHSHLLGAAGKDNSCVVMSVFVNPLQFRQEAYEAYPRRLDDDLDMASKNGVGAVFVPSVEEMYPGVESTEWLFDLQDQSTRPRDEESFITDPVGSTQAINYVRVPERLVLRMDGIDHPWHYDGVATVVRRLFEIVTPAKAYFGEKDIQQLAIIQAMNDWLNSGGEAATEIVPVAVVRDNDGLPSSSRLVMLDAPQREIAAGVTRLLKRLVHDSAGRRADEMIGECVDGIRAIKTGDHTLKIDSICCVDPVTLEPIDVIVSPAIVYIAYFINGIRLAETMRCC